MKFNYLYMRGRVGLSKILSGLGVCPGDHVALQAFTCSAVPEAVYAVGAIPVYIDIEENGVNMCPVKLQNCLKENHRIKAIIVQHTFGIPAAMDKFFLTCQKYNIPLIEDCCHTLDSSFDGKIVGSWASAAFYSFEWGKPIVAGMGGAVKTKDTDLLAYLKNDFELLSEPSLIQNLKNLIQLLFFKLFYRPRFYWFLKDAFHSLSRLGLATGNYPDEDIGFGQKASKEFTMKMPIINRYQLSLSVKNYTQDLHHRKKIGDLYLKEFRSNNKDMVMLVKTPVNTDICYSRFPILVSNKKLLLERARHHHIEIASFFDSPIHPLETADLEMVGYEIGACPNAEALCQQLISLPINKNITSAYVKHVFSFVTSSLP